MSRPAEDVRHPSAEGEAALHAALTLFHNRRGNPLEPILPTVEAHPDYLFGHLFLGAVLILTSERRFRAAGRTHLSKALALASTGTDREQALLAALAPLARDDWAGAGRGLDRYLVDHATDAFALQIGQTIDFFRGDSLNLRNRVARVLPAWSRTMPGYSYVLAMYAFGLEECHEYAQAEAAGLAALELEPRDGWAIHALAHVFEMQGRTGEGIDWLRARRTDWAPADPPNGFSCHNAWHLALLHLDRDEIDDCLAVLDEWIVPGVGDFAYGLADVTALLWRLRILGIDVGSRLAENASAWSAKQATEPGYYAFNDVHAALAFAGAGQLDAVALLIEAARTAVTGTGISAETAAAGLPLLHAIADYGAGRFAAAADALSNIRDGARAFGGSNAQRDLLTLLLISAAHLAGQPRQARHWLNERRMRVPASGMARRLFAQIGHS